MIAFKIKKNFRSTYLIKFFFLILALFLLIFPKGGFKLGSIPITWGYILLALVAFTMAFRKVIRIQKNHLSLLAFLLPFQIICALHFLINGFSNLGFTISFIINFYLLPLIFFLILSEHIKKIPLELLLNFIRKGVYFLACYGIFLFFYKIITGKFIGIPFLTINFGDSLSMEGKYIARGSIFKLISTYNNGNIFGICMLMVLPTYQHSEQKFYKKLIVKLALLLTLSRTVWVGLFIHEFLDMLMLSKNRTLKSIKLLAFLCLFTLLSVLIVHKINLNNSFFFDLTFGNRVQQFNALTTSDLFGKTSFASIREIVYMSILENFGYLGLISFCLAMFSPFIIKLQKGCSTPIGNVIASGLINYLIISFSDGAILFIPTLTIFWFLTSLMLAKYDILETSILKLEVQPY